MTIKTTPLSDKITLIEASDRLDQTQNSLLESALANAVETNPDLLIVDLSEVNYINSGGLRCLVTAWRLLRQNEKEVVLVGLSDRLLDIFSMVGFDKVFTIQPTVADALKPYSDTSNS